MPGMRNRRANPLTAHADALLSGKPYVATIEDGRLVFGQYDAGNPSRAKRKLVVSRNRCGVGVGSLTVPDGPIIAHTLNGEKLEVPAVLTFTRDARKVTARKVKDGILPATHADARAAELRAERARLLDIALRAGVANPWLGR